MAWIELHQTLPTNKKTLRLKRILKIKTPQAVGHLCMLWLWALDNAADGDLSSFEADEISEAAGWSGKDPEAFSQALMDSGFVDPDHHLHDWNEYAGRLISQREDQKEYKARRYALYNDMRLIKAVRARDGDVCQYCGRTVDWKDRRGAEGGTYDHVDPDGDNSAENVVVCCRSCNLKKGERTPEKANMPLITGKYRPEPTDVIPCEQAESRQKYGSNTAEKPVITVPNRTLPYPTVPEDTLPSFLPDRKEGKKETGFSDETTARLIAAYRRQGWPLSPGMKEYLSRHPGE